MYTYSRRNLTRTVNPDDNGDDDGTTFHCTIQYRPWMGIEHSGWCVSEWLDLDPTWRWCWGWCSIFSHSNMRIPSIFSGFVMVFRFLIRLRAKDEDCSTDCHWEKDTPSVQYIPTGWRHLQLKSGSHNTASASYWMSMWSRQVEMITFIGILFIRSLNYSRPNPIFSVNLNCMAYIRTFCNSLKPWWPTFS